MKFNIPEDETLDRLVDLIKEYNKWVDAEKAGSNEPVWIRSYPTALVTTGIVLNS